MRKVGTGLAVLMLLVVASPVVAQSDDGTIARVAFWRAKPGMTEEMEQGAKKHMEWHRKQNDPWSWYVWEIVSGDDYGMYGGGTFGHRWEDFDNSPVSSEEDKADADRNIFPYMDSVVIRYYSRLPDVSRPTPGDAPSTMSSVITFRLRFGKDAEFNRLIGKFHEAIGKTKWPVNYEWYQLVNGGKGPTYVLVLPRANWADFAPQEQSFEQMLEEAYGQRETKSLLDAWAEAVKGIESSIASSRPDLSYVATPND